MRISRVIAGFGDWHRGWSRFHAKPHKWANRELAKHLSTACANQLLYIITAATAVDFFVTCLFGFLSCLFLMILDCSCPFLFLCIYTIFHNLKARNIQAILLLAQCHAMSGSGKSLQIFGVRFASSARLRRSRRWSVRRNASGRAPATFRVVVA